MKQPARRYEPEAVEKKWSAKWIESGAFSAADLSDKPPYTIVIPPPNVTGALHIGHALNNTLQDILVRYKRMDGYNALWMPGTDHAGIATQNVVERQLLEEGIDRREMGREKFVERVWEWKAESGGTIINQLKSLGASCDWERERFTMDEGLSRAVREVFVSLYEEGLIYRGEYMINWCPRCHTALSDLEVEHQERDGHLWHIRYPLENGEGELIVATTRPETMLGDTAIAIHPEDERYKNFIGKNVILPIAERIIPIITDEYVDREFGTGALKITPAHDPNDFTIGEKHNLEFVKVIADDGTMTSNTPDRYTGMERFEARKQVIAELESAGLLVKTEDHRHAVGSCYRCHTIVEPNVSKQWFVKIAPLAEPAIKAVEDGDVKFVPEHWQNLYFEWMHNIRDWCISRQIWWGHQIPAWTCLKCGEVMVAREDPTECAKCGAADLERESDVLDTWFSSALWPFSTLGWPEKTDALKTFYPTSTLVTSFDIIFFWVARMIMMGLKFTGEAPLKEVYIHALVRDAEGKKMSKSKGNTIDPLEVMSQYGSDSLRMTLAAFAAQGRDIKLSEERIEGYRNFTNKVWNAFRFALMNLEGFDFAKADINRGDLALADRWILSRLDKTIAATRQAFDEYKFNDAAHHLYQFTWRELCDWYIELVKPRLNGDEEGADAARHTLAHTLESTLRLLHPIMPFITEELWTMVSASGRLLVLSDYPVSDSGLQDEEAEREMTVVMDVTTAIRNIRGELAVKPSTQLPVMMLVNENEPGLKATVEKQLPYINKLANVAGVFIDNNGEKPENSAVGVVDNIEIFVDLSGIVESDQGLEKSKKELIKAEEEIKFFQKKLSNKKFVENAPPEVVEKNRAKLAEYEAKAAKLRGSLINA